MRTTILSAALAAGLLATGPAPALAAPDDTHHAGSGLIPSAVGVTPPPNTLRGLDVSGYQGNVDWPAVAKAGAAFAYVKATESTDYTSGYFAQQYNSAAQAGLIRGAYHFAHPDSSTGKAQADYFLAHGGGWSADGQTLPGALDIEYAPSGDTCYGLTTQPMITWISSFVTEYRTRVKRAPVIYTTADWWSRCTGNYRGLATTAPLWVANYTGTALPLPSGWSTYTVWQTASSGLFPGDQNLFNGTKAQLRTFALGDYTPPPPPPTDAWPVLEQGSTGRAVSALQHLLAVSVDGDFGPATRSAVLSFQNSHGLTADGIVGAKTWSALAVTVQQGSTGNAVKAVQYLLHITIDGQFGANTRSAVTNFQKSNNLAADGAVGPQTWLALLS